MTDVKSQVIHLSPRGGGINSDKSVNRIIIIIVILTLQKKQRTKIDVCNSSKKCFFRAVSYLEFRFKPPHLDLHTLKIQLFFIFGLQMLG